MRNPKTIIHIIILTFIFLGCVPATLAYSQAKPAHQHDLQALIKQEGDIFLVVHYPKAGQVKPCIEENSLTNQLSFKGDSAFVNYINYTELFCEAYVLRTQYLYYFNLKDIDPASMRLIEKKYNYGDGKLQEGPETWFELQVFTKDNKPVIRKQDVESKHNEYIQTVNLLFKSKQGAKEGLTLFKSILSATNM